MRVGRLCFGIMGQARAHRRISSAFAPLRLGASAPPTHPRFHRRRRRRRRRGRQPPAARGAAPTRKPWGPMANSAANSTWARQAAANPTSHKIQPPLRCATASTPTCQQSSRALHAWRPTKWTARPRPAHRRPHRRHRGCRPHRRRRGCRPCRRRAAPTLLGDRTRKTATNFVGKCRLRTPAHAPASTP